MNSVEAVVASVRSFEREAHALLSRHESGRSRVVTLRRAHRDLSHLSVAQAGLLKQALTCVEHGLHRAACVMAWCAVIDLIIEKLASDNFAKLAALRPKWNTSSHADLRESVNEHQLVEAARELKVLSKSEMKALIGMLSKRNDCAHPSAFEPGLDEALGYVAEALRRVRDISGRSL